MREQCCKTQFAVGSIRLAELKRKPLHKRAAAAISEYLCFLWARLTAEARREEEAYLESIEKERRSERQSGKLDDIVEKLHKR